MIKGISRRVVVVKSPDPEIFDEAIFIVRDEYLKQSRGGFTGSAAGCGTVSAAEHGRTPAVVFTDAAVCLCGSGCRGNGDCLACSASCRGVNNNGQPTYRGKQNPDVSVFSWISDCKERKNMIEYDRYCL